MVLRLHRTLANRLAKLKIMVLRYKRKTILSTRHRRAQEKIRKSLFHILLSNLRVNIHKIIGFTVFVKYTFPGT
jgi:hypothetical protein